VPELNYHPRRHFLPFHQRKERYASLVCHRRSGKTVASVNEAVLRALYTPKDNARYAYIAPFRQQGKDVAWQYLKMAAEPFVSSLKEIRESELRVRLINGSWITIYGSDNPDALRGLYLDGVVLDEVGDMRPNLWHEVVLPTLADRKGWAVFIGTPKGHNLFHKVNEAAKTDPNWYQMTLKASESGILDDEELGQMKAQMSEDQYAQELECSFDAAVLGTYYAQIIEKLEKQGHMSKSNLYDPEFPVNAAADLGFSDSTAFWFWQHRPDGIAMIDHHEAQGQPLQYYFDLLDGLNYNYETIWLPHDARAKTLQTGRSTVEQFIDQDFPVRIVPQLSVQQGIDAARLVLPHVHFDKQNTLAGVEALRAYRRQYNQLTKSFADKPLHDWASDSSDAFRYLSLVARTSLNIPANDNPEKDAIIKPLGYTLDQLFEDNEHKKSVHETLRI